MANLLGLRYKPQAGNTAWWQQTSTDMSSDHEVKMSDFVLDKISDGIVEHGKVD